MLFIFFGLFLQRNKNTKCVICEVSIHPVFTFEEEASSLADGTDRISSASSHPQNIVSKRSSLYDTAAKSIDGNTEVDSLWTNATSKSNFLSTRDEYSLQVRCLIYKKEKLLILGGVHVLTVNTMRG